MAETETRDSRPTRGTPVVVMPTKGDALSLKAGEFGEIITVFAAANYNCKKMHGEVIKMIQHMNAASEGEAHL